MQKLQIQLIPNWKDGYRKPQQGSFLQIKRQTPSYSFVVMGHINAIASNQTCTWVGWLMPLAHVGREIVLRLCFLFSLNSWGQNLWMPPT